MLTCTCAPANQRPHKACFKQLQRSSPHQSQSLISQFSQLSLSRLMLPMPWTADSLRLPSTSGVDLKILRLSQVIVPLLPSLALMPFLLLRSPSSVWPPPCLTTLQIPGFFPSVIILFEFFLLRPGNSSNSSSGWESHSFPASSLSAFASLSTLSRSVQTWRTHQLRP